jgi:hypothetical protein
MQVFCDHHVSGVSQLGNNKNPALAEKCVPEWKQFFGSGPFI